MTMMTDPMHEPVMSHYGYNALGYAPDGTAIFTCKQDGAVVADRHAHDDFHRSLPFMVTMTSPEMADLLQREPGQDFE